MNARLEVAMLIQGYLPRVGGAERQLAYVAPLLQAQKVRVDVITRRYRGLTAFEVVDGVPVHRMPVPGPKALASLSYTVAAVSLLRRLRPSVVRAHEMFSPATTALAARAVLGCAVVVTAHRGGVLGDTGETRAAGDLHVDHREASRLGGPHNFCHLFGIELGLVQFGAADDDRLAPHETLMKVPTGERHAIRHKQNVRILEVRGLRRDQRQLHGPVGELGSRSAACEAA